MAALRPGDVAVTQASGILHLLLRAEPGVWRDCQRCCADDDTVVLADAAVMAVVSEDFEGRPRMPCAVVFSSPDASARGVTGAAASRGMRAVDDDELVALIEMHGRCLSWR